MQGRPNFDLGIDQTGRPHHLFHHRPRRMLLFERAGGGGNKDGLAAQALELVKAQRPVIQRRGQPEAVFDQGFLARAITSVHPAQLWHGHMAFIDEN